MSIHGKGHAVMSNFMDRYGSKKGKKVAYATANKRGKGSKLYSLLHGK